jgi:hypothetical protein
MPAKLSHSIITKTLSSTLLTSALVACGGGSSGGDGNQSNEHAATAYGINIALISTSAEEPDKADITLATLEEDGSYTLSVGGTPRNQPNYNIARHGEYFYQIGGRDIDKLSKYHFESPTTPIFEDYSLLENPEDTTGSHRLMVFASQNKAYIPIYANSKILVVNPSAQSEAELITGVLDLGAYGAHPSDVIIVDNKLYIALQHGPGWTEPAYIAIFDTTTDKEIDTNPNDDPNSLKGIYLDTSNPSKFVWKQGTGLFLQSRGIHEADAVSYLIGRNLSYTGGITQIDTENYDVTTIVDDGDLSDSPYGYISDLAIIDGSNGYFTGLNGETYNLFHFSPASGEVSAVTNYSDLKISALASDPLGNLWIGISDPSTPRIEILGSGQEHIKTLNLIQNPNRILFAN